MAHIADPGLATPSAPGLTFPATRPAFQAQVILHIGYTLLPIVAGLDKFTNWLVNWDQPSARLAVGRSLFSALATSSASASAA